MRGAWTADRVPPFVPSGWDGPSSTTDSLMAGTTSPFPCLEDRKGQHLEGFCPSAFVIILGNEGRGFERPSNQRTSFLEVVHSQGELRAAPDGAKVDRADHVDVDAGLTEDRRELREFARTIRHVDVNLDQCFLPHARIAFRAYKRCVPSPGGEFLILLRRIRRFDDAIPTDVRGNSGPRHRAV